MLRANIFKGQNFILVMFLLIEIEVKPDWPKDM